MHTKCSADQLIFISRIFSWENFNRKKRSWEEGTNSPHLCSQNLRMFFFSIIRKKTWRKQNLISPYRNSQEGRAVSQQPRCKREAVVKMVQDSSQRCTGKTKEQWAQVSVRKIPMEHKEKKFFPILRQGPERLWKLPSLALRTMIHIWRWSYVGQTLLVKVLPKIFYDFKQFWFFLSNFQQLEHVNAVLNW